MKNIDLLYFDSNGYKSADAGQVNDLFIADMGLENIKNLWFFDNFETYNTFINTISVPLTDTKKIKERQDILKDFMEFPEIAQRMKSLCDKNRENKCEIHDYELSPKDQLIEFQKILYRSMDISCELASQLKDRDFCSESLNDLRNQLDCREKIERVKSRLNTFVECCVSDNVALSVEYGSCFKFKSADIYSGENKKSSNTKAERLWQKFFHTKMPTRKKITDGFYYYDINNPIYTPLFAEIEGEKGVLNASVSYASSVITNLNRHILSFCSDLSRQLAFYIACVEIVKFMENKRIPTVFPEICADSPNDKHIKAKNLLDFGLFLAKNLVSENSSPVTANNFNDCGNAVYLISGANQGGKTTFIKSIGIAQLFAQAGLKVPAEEYNCPVFNNFFSHFSRDEDEDLNFGKLAEELMRIKRAMPMITDNALVLFNESFATTTESEGFEIASDILRVISETSSKVLFVTHNYHLLKKRSELNELLAHGMKIKSLIVSEAGNLSDRTYKIVEGEPQENINTIGFFEKHYTCFTIESKN